jgi:ribosomal protein L40E
MFCPKCATKNPDIAQYCRQCGEQMVTTKKPDIDKPQGSKADSFFKAVGIIVVIFFALAIISNC